MAFRGTCATYDITHGFNLETFPHAQVRVARAQEESLPSPPRLVHLPLASITEGGGIVGAHGSLLITQTYPQNSQNACSKIPGTCFFLRSPKRRRQARRPRGGGRDPKTMSKGDFNEQYTGKHCQREILNE